FILAPEMLEQHEFVLAARPAEDKQIAVRIGTIGSGKHFLTRLADRTLAPACQIDFDQARIVLAARRYEQALAVGAPGRIDQQRAAELGQRRHLSRSEIVQPDLLGTRAI